MNKIVENAIAAHRAKNDAEGEKVANAITSKQYMQIQSWIESVGGDVTDCIDLVGDFVAKLDNILRVVSWMSSGFDDEAKKDAFEIKDQVTKCRAKGIALKNDLSKFDSLIGKKFDKYAYYD